MRASIGRAAAASLAAALTLTALAAPPAGAAPQGKKSLASVLAADSGFDKNPRDFDILEAAVGVVLAEKPDSAVGLLADGKTALTAFLPNDRAFFRLVRSVTGKSPATERRTVDRLLDFADADTIETVLLYHVVPGVTLRSPRVIKKATAGDDVATAQGGTFHLRVVNGNVKLVDEDTNAPSAKAIVGSLDINKGNRQIGHAINRVLRPVDLPPLAQQ